MRALSVSRPWPWLILHCGKTVENRTWTTTYRGPVIIHSARSHADDGMDFARHVEQLTGRDLGVSAAPRSACEHPTGFVGAVDLVDVCSATVDTAKQAPGGVARCGCGPWANPGQHHWLITNPRPLAQPIMWPGALGLWRLTQDAAEALLAGLAAEPVGGTR